MRRQLPTTDTGLVVIGKDEQIVPRKTEVFHPNPVRERLIRPARVQFDSVATPAIW